jgi:hypothetical protein
MWQESPQKDNSLALHRCGMVPGLCVVGMTHELLRDGMFWFCTCGNWTPPLGSSVRREFDKHLINVRNEDASG